jgi:hypothetical protein
MKGLIGEMAKTGRTLVLGGGGGGGFLRLGQLSESEAT